MSHEMSEAAVELLRVRANLLEVVLGKLGMQPGTQMKATICADRQLFSLMVCSLIERYVELREAISLDDFVHDIVSEMGSAINNGGVGAQMEFLLRETNEVSVWETLTDQLVGEIDSIPQLGVYTRVAPEGRRFTVEVAPMSTDGRRPTETEWHFPEVWVEMKLIQPSYATVAETRLAIMAVAHHPNLAKAGR